MLRLSGQLFYGYPDLGRMRTLALVSAIGLIGGALLTVAGVSHTLGRAFPELTLIRPDTFDGPIVGHRAELSPDGAAVATLVKRSDIAAFERMATSDNPERQVYGLVGLYSLDRERFNRAASAIDLSQSVAFREADVVRETTIAWIVAERLEWRSPSRPDYEWASSYARSATP